MVDHLIKFAELFLRLPFRTLGLSLSIAFDDLLASEKLFVARFFVLLRLPGHTMFSASQHLLAVFFFVVDWICIFCAFKIATRDPKL